MYVLITFAIIIQMKGYTRFNTTIINPPSLTNSTFGYKWQSTAYLKAAAIIHMLLNNLDPAVAQFPQELVTYGGNGQVLIRNFPF